mgnify:CR=1 FL=1
MNQDQINAVNASRARQGKGPTADVADTVVEASQGSLYTPTTVARQTVGQGLALGFGDEIEGFARGIYKAATEGKPYGAAVNEEISKIRTSNKQFEDENPLGSTALQLGGGLLTGGAGLLRAGAMRAPTLLGRVRKAALPSAAIGAVTGAGMSEGSIVDRAPAAGLGAGFGSVLGGLTPVATKVVGSGVRAAGRLIPGQRGGAQRQAERLIRSVGAEDELEGANLGQKIGDFGDGAMATDVGGPATRNLSRYAGNKHGGLKAQTELEARHLDQGPRIAKSVDENFATDNLEDFVETTTKARKASADANYGALYESTVEMSPRLAKLFRNPGVREAYERAKKIAEKSGRDLPPLYKVVDGRETYLPPTMRTLDFIKRALDDDVNVAFRGDQNELGFATKELRDDFRDTLDYLVPEYKAVRSLYAGYSAAMEAAELGKKFILNQRSVGVNAVKDLGEHEKKAFLVGVADALRLKVLSAPDEADAVKKIFGDHNSRKRIMLALDGDDKALDAFQKTMEREAAFARTNANVRFGSRTNPMQESVKTFENIGGAIGDAGVVMSGHANPGSVSRLVAKATDYLNTPPEAVAKKVSELLLSTDPKKRAMAATLLSQGPSTVTRASPVPTSAAVGAGSVYGGDTASQMINALTGRR